MSNDVSGTSSVSRESRTLACDTGVLRPKILTYEEKEILSVASIIFLNRCKNTQCSSRTECRISERVTLGQPGRTVQKNNVIMIDGVRGAGKTSLLNTSAQGLALSGIFQTYRTKKKNSKK